MFNVKHQVEAVASWLGVDVTDAIGGLLDRYADWLRAEAAPAGGIGPAEVDRLEERHIADSISFAAGWRQRPDTAVDLGSGVGLPGIPLAITFPDVEFLLVDRAGRRVDLAERAVRVLGLENVSLVRAEIASVSGRYDTVLMRAALRPGAAGSEIARLLDVQGSAVVGLGGEQAAEEMDVIRRRFTDHSLVLEVIEVPMLDSPRSLLRITHA